jgi:predicted transcriptional regulator
MARGKPSRQKVGASETPRDNLLRVMQERGLKAHPWAKAAGLRSSTIYNFLAGTTQSLSADTLSRLAAVAGVSVDELLGSAAPAKPKQTVKVEGVVGVYGRIYQAESEQDAIDRPPGIAPDADVAAVRVDGDGLHPIPAGWHVVYEREPRDPETLLRKLAVVLAAGATHAVVREIRRGSTAGLYTLIGWSTAPAEDVEITRAHAIVAIVQPLTASGG